MKDSIIACVAEHAEMTPNKVAVIDRDSSTTYGELYDMAKRGCQYLRSHGVKKGDIVVTKASQDLAHVVIYLSAHLSGCVYAPLERSVSDEAMVRIAGEIGASVLITDSAGVAKSWDGRLIDRKGLLAAEELPPEDGISFPKPEDSADIMFTTGTTGKSKGVEITHHALIATAENYITACKYQSDTILIVAGPMNHGNAARRLVATLANGSSIHILNGFLNLKLFFEAIDHAQGHIGCILPPSAIRTIFQSTHDLLGKYANRIDFVESASSPLPETDKQHLCKLLPHSRLYNSYGSTESAAVCMYDYSEYPGRERCIGKSLKNSNVIVVNENREPICSSRDRPGILACYGDINMKGYVNAPELTRQVLVNGVMYSNDMVYMDDEGFIYILGREDDVINVGGLKVAPDEVEAAALAYPGVEDCICISIPNPITQHALKLLVVMDEDSALAPMDMRLFLSAKLESYKIPRHYEVVDKVVRNANGKLDRKFYR